MEIIFSSKKVEELCSNFSKAKKEYGGAIAESLFARINLIKSANDIKDIIAMHNLNFHALKGEEKGKFVIDVKSRRDSWRIILEPLDKNNARFNPCNIDEIISEVKKIMIVKVSKHYE